MFHYSGMKEIAASIAGTLAAAIILCIVIRSGQRPGSRASTLDVDGSVGALPGFASTGEELQFLREWLASREDAVARTREPQPATLLASAAVRSNSEGIPTRRALQEEGGSLRELQQQIVRLRAQLKELTKEKAVLDGNLQQANFNWDQYFFTPEVKAKARSLLQRCSGSGIVLPGLVPVWKGYACSASNEQIRQFLAYRKGGVCPDDWFEAQHLIFVHHCYSLPKRRCFAPTPRSPKEPLPFPGSVFSQAALQDASVRWALHECQSFRCLNQRLVGDCRNCFNMSLERNRWLHKYRGSLSAADVLALKKGSIRLGLDAGGGTGSFAARMALFNVTVLTTAMNIETVMNRMHGLPYMETIGLRGLIPLWVPHKARLPFFDGTLDLIHCVNSIKYLPMLEFEELLFEWDRVLRVGGVLWFEMFYAPVAEMPVYMVLIEQLGYRRLFWEVFPKPDDGERAGAHVYLNCVIEKPARSRS